MSDKAHLARLQTLNLQVVEVGVAMAEKMVKTGCRPEICHCSNPYEHANKLLNLWADLYDVVS